MEEVKDMRKEVKQVIGIFGAWILIAVSLYLIMPPDLKWIAWLPVGLILIAVIISSTTIFLKKTGYLKPKTAWVNGREYTACQFCPNNRIKENPVNKDLLIYNCSASGMRTIYVPGKVPGWCPYVIR